MGAPRISGMFQFTYYKTGSQIKKAFQKKMLFLRKKINERQGRIDKVRKDYDITDKDLLEIYAKVRSGATNSMLSNAVTYSKTVFMKGDKVPQVQERTIAIGVINNIDSEQKSMDEEKNQLERAELIIRNISPRKKFHLGEDELEYLGF